MKTTAKPKKSSSKAKAVKQYTVYRIENTVTGKSYIGCTQSELIVRKRRHLWELRTNQHHSKKLQSDFNLYGESAFVWHILHSKEMSKEKAEFLESQLIEKFDSQKSGYNITKGGKSAYPGKHWEKSIKRPIVWGNVEYRSITEAAKKLGVHLKTMQERLAKGHTCDADLKSPNRKVQYA